MAGRLVWKLKMVNLMEIEEHLHLVEQDLCFEVEIPLAQKACGVVDGQKLEGSKHDWQKVELVGVELVAPQEEPMQGALELLRKIAVLESAGKVLQLEEHMMMVEAA